jgi:hypothetical protein
MPHPKDEKKPAGFDCYSKSIGPNGVGCHVGTQGLYNHVVEVVNWSHYDVVVECDNRISQNSHMSFRDPKGNFLIWKKKRYIPYSRPPVITEVGRCPMVMQFGNMAHESVTTQLVIKKDCPIPDKLADEQLQISVQL